jgi:hypothetical protein
VSLVGVLVNPNARKNAGQPDRAARLAAVLGERGLVRETRTLAEVGPCLEALCQAGVTTFVADGGDGSLHWLLNAAAARGGVDRLAEVVPLALPTNGGTIDFVARHAGVKGRAEALMRRLVATPGGVAAFEVSRVPTLVLRGERQDGARFERVGFAAAIAGIGSGFFDLYERSRRGPLGILQVIARTSAACVLDLGPWRRLATRALLEDGRRAMGRVAARVEVDGRPLPFAELTALHVGAFPINLGGLVRVFPEAGEGALHMNGGDPTILGMIRNLPRLLLGRPLAGRGLVDGPARALRVEATGPAPLRPVVDGERLEGVRWLEVSPGPVVTVPRVVA